jgi:RNA polymerase sigma-70 factor (ECF subfamily)
MAKAAAAMQDLCRLYWFPIYHFLRRNSNPQDAEDLTQGFFAYLLKYETIQKAKRKKGRFRSFLLNALKNFLANQFDRDHTIKRGRDEEIISLEGLAAEELYGREPANLLTPDKLYERQCACALLAQALQNLKKSYARAGKADRFEVLVGVLTGAEAPYATYAAKLNMPEGNVKVEVYRLREAFRKAIKTEVAQTVASPEDIDDEIRHLFVAVGFR